MWLARRMFSTLLVIWLATTLVFFALRIVPGDAIQAQLIQAGADEAAIEQYRALYGLADPLWVQYGRFWSRLLHGDMGQSLLYGLPVTEMIIQQLVPTVQLAAGALVVATALGISLGIAGALNLPWGVPLLARLVINLSLSTPIYWTGTLAIFVFSARLGWLPSAGGQRLSHLILPVAVLGFHTAGAIARTVQASIQDVLSMDFVRLARAKGLPESVVIGRHVLRVALLPVVTVIALQAGFLLSGTVITESLFVRPGIGRLLLDATLRQDYPVVQGVVIVTATAYTMLNTLADVLHCVLDPRVAT